MDDNQLLAALQAEYLHTQRVIEDFDARALTIKTWSVSFSLGAFGAAFSTKADVIFLVSAASALLFWFIEGSWKTFQTAYYARSELIEAHFRGEARIPSPFQISTSWQASWRAGGLAKLWRVMWWPHVAAPHVAIAALGLTLYLLGAAGPPSPEQ